ncbi:hypothetical protein ACWCV9_06035 [Streptomyces sp. NPDC001606]
MFQRITARTGALAAASLAAATLLTCSGTAVAGTNGQQIVYTDASNSLTHSIQIEGYNQNGQYLDQCFQVNAGGKTYISGWWWKGSEYVKAFGNSGCTGTSWRYGTTVNVPAYQSSSDWFPVWGY